MSKGLPIELSELDKLTCPKCQNKIVFHTWLAHSCYLDRRNYDIESQVWKCTWCDLEMILPIARKVSE